MNRRRLAVAAVALAGVVVVGGAFVYSTFLAGDNVPQLGLDTPAPSATGGTPSGAGASPTAPSVTPTSAPGTPVAAGDLAGSWTIASGVAGYRVRETFLQQNAETDAVGRTEGVTGSLTVDGTPGALRLASTQISVDMTTLRSDRDRRDGQLRGRGIQSDTFPTSTFELGAPVVLPADFGGADVAVTLPGRLTLHGVVKDVSITAQARLEADGTVVVAGSLPILFADYGIEAPSIAGLISVQDRGSMEFRVVFAKG